MLEGTQRAFRLELNYSNQVGRQAAKGRVAPEQVAPRQAGLVGREHSLCLKDADRFDELVRRQ